MSKKITDGEEIFRNYMNIALKEGFVKENANAHKAALQIKNSVKLVPTFNFEENILKLREGLIDKGLVNFASALENKFLNYKKAQSLYDVTKETGEELIEKAHPEGSPEYIESKEDHGVVENIVDRQKKIKKVLEKEPTGKLANAAFLIKNKIKGL